MRRAEREVSRAEDIIEMLGRCECLRVAFFAEPAPYIVPLCFGFDAHSGGLTLYFHSAPEGRKMDLMRAHPRVGFEAEASYRVAAGDSPCGHTAAYESVVGEGCAYALESPEDKLRAMRLILGHYGLAGAESLTSRDLAKTALIAIRVESVTGKRNLPR